MKQDNRNKCYILEWLLKTWGISINSDVPRESVTTNPETGGEHLANIASPRGPNTSLLDNFSGSREGTCAMYFSNCRARLIAIPVQRDFRQYLLVGALILHIRCSSVQLLLRM